MPSHQGPWPPRTLLFHGLLGTTLLSNLYWFLYLCCYRWTMEPVCSSLFFLTNWSCLFYSPHIHCFSVISDSIWSLVSDLETTGSSSITFILTPYPEIQEKEDTQSLSFIKWVWLLICIEDENNNTYIFFEGLNLSCHFVATQIILKKHP